MQFQLSWVCLLDVGCDSSPTRRNHLPYATTMGAYLHGAKPKDLPMQPWVFVQIPTPISWEKAAVDNFSLLHDMMQYAPNLEVAKFPYSSLASRPTEACAFLLWFPNSRHCGLLEQKHYLQLPYSHKTWYMVTYAYTPNKEGQHLPYPMSTSSVSHIYWKGNRPPSSELQPCLPGFLRSKDLKWQLKERLKKW